MLRFAGWTAEVPGPDGSAQHFGKFTEPSAGYLHIVHTRFDLNSGHFFVLDLRRCERTSEDGEARRFSQANILDSRKFPFSFNVWFSTTDYMNCTYIRLEKDVRDMRKADAMEQLMKVADIVITGKRSELTFFDPTEPDKQ